MTRYKKIAISMPLRAAESVRRAVKAGQADSVSAYIVQAIEEKAKKETMREFLDEMLEASGGPTTPEERKEMDRLLHGPPIPWQQQVKDLEKRRARDKRRLEQYLRKKQRLADKARAPQRKAR
jgi:hypothetical protein